MKTTYNTVVRGFGKHAAIEIPDKNLTELRANKRAPLKITVNTHTYQSTANGVEGKCMVVFPMRDRIASGTAAGDRITVTLELDSGYRDVEVPKSLEIAIFKAGMTEVFNNLTYSKRKEFAKQIQDAKTDDTHNRRVEKVLASIRASK